jgi:hypothetical protein
MGRGFDMINRMDRISMNRGENPPGGGACKALMGTGLNVKRQMMREVGQEANGTVPRVVLIPFSETLRGR